MPDISQTLVAKSDQLNGDDLLGREITVTVRAVNVRDGDQPVSVSYEGDAGKPYKPCLSMRRVLAHAWGNQTESWLGKRMTLYRNPDVNFGDMKVGGIRISHLSDIPKSQMAVPLTATRGRKMMYSVERLGEAPQPDPEPPKPAEIPYDLEERARLAAGQGTTTFREWYKTVGRDDRTALQSIMEDLKAAASEADARGAPTEADPFGGGEREPGED